MTSPGDSSQDSRRVLMAVAAGRVRRGPVAARNVTATGSTNADAANTGSTNTGPANAGTANTGAANAGPANAGRYLLDGAECVDAALVSLVGNDLVFLPAGNEPPRLTPDGEAVLTNFT